MQRGGTAVDFRTSPIRGRHLQRAGHDGAPAVDGRAASESDPAWALLAASGPVQYAPPMAAMRQPLTVSVVIPVAAPAETVAVEAGMTDVAAADGRPVLRGPELRAPESRIPESQTPESRIPELRADTPLARRPASSGRRVLVGAAVVLAAAAAAGGYLTLGMQRNGGGQLAVAADSLSETSPSAAGGDAVAPPTPVEPVAVARSSAGAVGLPAPGSPDVTGTPDVAEAPDAAGAAGDAGVPAAPQDPGTMIRSAQSALAGAGLDPGPVDGLMGSKTRAAVIAYQRRIGVEADGEIDAALLQQLATARRLSDDDIPPARLPVAPAPEAAPQTTAADGRPGLLDTFNRVFGRAAESPQASPTLAEAGGGQ